MDDISLHDSTNKHWGFLWLAIVLLATLYFVTGSDWLLVFLIPLALGAIYGTWSGRTLVGAASMMADHASRKAVGKWQGKYYSWNNRQIRILESDDCAWVVDEDLISAVGIKLDSNLRRKLEISYAGYGTIPRTRFSGFNENAVMEFLDGKQAGDPEIVKLKLWFERDVFFPLRNRKRP